MSMDKESVIDMFIAVAFGGLAGGVYWAMKGNLLAAAVSLHIPLYGPVTVIMDLL